MRLAALCLSVLVAVAGCSHPNPAAETDASAAVFTVEIVNPDNPRIVVSGVDLTFRELVQEIEDFKASPLYANEPRVFIHAEPETAYEDIARVMLACGKAGTLDLQLNDFAFRLPDGPGQTGRRGPVPIYRLGREPMRLEITGPAIEGRAARQDRIKVELLDEGPNGEDVSVTIAGDTREFGADFDALGRRMVELWGMGTPSDTPVLIFPTMATRCKYVLQAVKTVKETGFCTIHFGIPYE